MRKRAQRRDIPSEVSPTLEKSYVEKKKIMLKQNWWMAIVLISIFFLVLLLNSYFNYTSGVAINHEGNTLLEKFYLSGPDPYYHARCTELIVENGYHPYWTIQNPDPLLNYPLVRPNPRPPIFDWSMAIGGVVFSPFFNGNIQDSLGYVMQFAPAIFGALLVFPIYFIGTLLFDNKKAGLIAALMVAIIPIHIGSGHGSAYSLTDHDSFVLLFSALGFLFFLKALKTLKDRRWVENWRKPHDIKTGLIQCFKVNKTSLLYGALAGTSIVTVGLAWEGFQVPVAIIGLYCIIQIFIDHWRNKDSTGIFLVGIVTLFLVFLLTFPYYLLRGDISTVYLVFFVFLVVFITGLVMVPTRDLPGIVVIPSIIGIGVGVLVLLFVVSSLGLTIGFLTTIANIVFGGITYVQPGKVTITIAEAGTYDISRTVMSFGPAIYWLAWLGLVLLLLQLIKKWQKEILFFSTWFFLEFYLSTSAGRFLNDSVPLMALLAGGLTWIIIDRLDYKQMSRNIRAAGGGFHGLRRGIKLLHIFGILLVAFVIILPSSFIAFNAAVPGVSTKNGSSNMKYDYFGSNDSVYGLGFYKEQYWVDAYSWLNDQDTEIKDPAKRPGFISWWDYGFYEAAVGAHPTVADNFQDGIPPAANFHTAKSEKEGVAVFIVRILQGDMKDNNGKISPDVIVALEKYVGANNTANITSWFTGTASPPSLNKPIGEEYDKDLSTQYPVRSENAIFHDVVNLLNATLDDEGITELYRDIQSATGYSIRYYGVEGYDMAIFNIFGFLGDKSIVLPALRSRKGLDFYNPEDDFIKIHYVGYIVNRQQDGTIEQVNGTWTADEINKMSQDERKNLAITDTQIESKPDYYNTMFFKTYIGNSPYRDQVQLPCWDMKHFYAEFVSKYPYYDSGKSAVVIAKYYEGARINGSVTFMGDPLDAKVFVQKNITLYQTTLPIDHDNATTNNGQFSVIAPAGNITLQVRRYLELDLNAFPLKNVSFDSTNDTELAPISEAEATRTPGADYERTVNITIDPASIDGYVYLDNDNDKAYNISSDNPLSNAEVTLIEINQFDPATGSITQTGSVKVLTTDEKGHYNASDLLPGFYVMRVVLDGFVIHENYLRLYSGMMSYNISKPLPGAVDGTVYYDANKNTAYDAGEEMSNIDVRLLYETLEGTTKQIGTLITDEKGSYAFYSLVPGQYVINATKANTTTGYLDYATETTVTLTENETTSFNVSLTYAPIAVRGYTTYGTTNVKSISIKFEPDNSIENNTAQQIQATSNENGSHSIALQPGIYNVSVSKKEGSTLVYSFNGKLNVHIGEGIKSFDILLTKHSATISGSTKYASTPISNLSITFSPNTTVTNNTAIYTSAASDANGVYSIELAPGSYNITVDELVNESGFDVTYTFTGSLEISTAETAKTFDIALTKKE